MAYFDFEPCIECKNEQINVGSGHSNSPREYDPDQLCTHCFKRWQSELDQAAQDYIQRLGSSCRGSENLLELDFSVAYHWNDCSQLERRAAQLKWPQAFSKNGPINPSRGK